MPLETIVNICERDPVELESSLINRGLQTEIFPDGECLRRGGALYTYHEVALGALLKKHVDVLADAGWPDAVAEFVKTSATTRAELHTKLFTVVAHAFADYDNTYSAEL